MYPAKVFLWTLLLGMGVQAYPQKVALVLSGGGAKGIAHVGVLKALEENNIPVDYLVGTSMGAVVAGAYAAGYSAERLEEIMVGAAFRHWVNGNLEKGYNYFYNKETPNGAFLSLELSLDSAFHASLNSSIASDLSLNFALAELFAQPSAVCRYNFDSLFIPVRVVAADIFTQQEIVLREGSLGQALRTSLSVPFFYKPIKMNDKYLFDGGIYNNFPVDVAIEEFDPDVIIGVNVSSKVFDHYPYKNDEELLNNSLLYMLLDKSDPKAIPASGIYIEPDLRGYTAFDFSKARSLIDSGYVWAMNHMDEIKAKVRRQADSSLRKEKRKAFQSANPPLCFKDIKFHGFNSKQRKYINRIFNLNKDKTLDIEEIKKGYFRLVSEDFFNTIYPDITYDPEDKAYQLEIYGRPTNNFNVEVGGTIASRNISQIFLGLQHYYFDNYLLKNSLSFYTGSFYKSAQFKSRLNLATFNQLYLEPELTYNHWNFIDADDIFIRGDDPALMIRTDRKYGLNIGFPIGSRFKGVLNAAAVNNTDRFSNASSFTAADTLDLLKTRGIRAGAFIEHNNLNRKQYASDGQSFKLSIDYFNMSEQYFPGSTSTMDKVYDKHQWFRAKAQVQQYFKRGNYSTGYLVEAVVSNQPFLSNYYATLINAPAFNPLQDSRTLFLRRFRAHDYLAVGLRNVLTVRPNLDLRLEGYLFKPLQSIEQNQDQTPDYAPVNEEVNVCATAAAVLHSPIGPISLSANYYDDSQARIGILLHVGFLLFHNRSME